jgi:hypothetical protein
METLAACLCFEYQVIVTGWESGGVKAQDPAIQHLIGEAIHPLWTEFEPCDGTFGMKSNVHMLREGVGIDGNEFGIAFLHICTTLGDPQDWVFRDNDLRKGAPCEEGQEKPQKGDSE